MDAQSSLSEPATVGCFCSPLTDHNLLLLARRLAGRDSRRFDRGVVTQILPDGRGAALQWCEYACIRAERSIHFWKPATKIGGGSFARCWSALPELSTRHALAIRATSTAATRMGRVIDEERAARRTVNSRQKRFCSVHSANRIQFSLIAGRQP